MAPPTPGNCRDSVAMLSACESQADWYLGCVSWLSRLFGTDSPSRRELRAVGDELSALDARVDARYSELKALRSSHYALKRRVEDAPGSTIDTAEVGEVGPGQSRGQGALATSEGSRAHLSARFRRF